MNSMLVRLVLGGLIVLALEIRGAESTNEFHAQQIAEWIALPKPRDPPADDRVFRCVAALADARQAGLNPAEVAAKAVARAGLSQVLGQLTKEAILRNLKTVEDNKRRVRRYLEEVVNTGNVEALADFIAPNYVEVFNNVRHPAGVEGAKQHILGVRETYPDLHLTVEQQIAEGEWVVTRVTARGTHLGGTWLGMKPTGKRVEINAVNVDRVVDGRIVEHGGAANVLEPLLAIGAIRVASSAE